jgi:glycosyltransferase involved in cell wall biosynthesis
MNNKPTVLMVGNFLSRAGGTRFVCEELASRMADRGWATITTSSNRRAIPRLVDMLRTTWVERNRYDVAQVDVYSGRAFIWAEAVTGMLQCLRKPYVVTLHGGNLPAFASLNRRRTTRLFQAAGAVTAPSAYLAERMRPFRPDLLVLPNGIDLSAYPFRLRLAPRPRLIWLRAFHRVYNPVLAVRVLAAIKGRFPAAELIMVGPDREDGSLAAARAEAVRLGISGQVQFHGAVPKKDVPDWLNQGDIFLNTSSIDNTPVSVLEAMAAGNCIVSSDVGGVPFLLTHRLNAMLVPPDNPAAMASAVESILDDRKLAARLSAKARAAVELFDWDSILPRWDSLLLSIAGRSGRSLLRSDSAPLNQ